MAVQETTARRKRRQKIQSSHVAPPGHKDRVAQPRERPAPVAAGPSPVRRRRGRGQPRRKASPAPATMTQQRGQSVVLSARMLSAVILFSLLVVLFLFFQSDAFYVHRIEVGGLNYLDAAEVFTLSGVANLHIFWVDAEEVRRAVLRSPSVADAEVRVGWPPHLVQIEVQERAPALVWEQAGVRTWIDVRGRVMPQRTDLQGLLRIVVEGQDRPLGPNDVIPQDVVDGALQLRALFPNIEVLLYSPMEGLGYQDGRGWRVWFGSGTNMSAKLAVYNALVENLMARGIQPEYIDVGDVDAPYYKEWWGREIQATPAVDSQ